MFASASQDIFSICLLLWCVSLVRDERRVVGHSQGCLCLGWSQCLLGWWLTFITQWTSEAPEGLSENAVYCKVGPGVNFLKPLLAGWGNAKSEKNRTKSQALSKDMPLRQKAAIALLGPATLCTYPYCHHLSIKIPSCSILLVVVSSLIDTWSVAFLSLYYKSTLDCLQTYLDCQAHWMFSLAKQKGWVRENCIELSATHLILGHHSLHLISLQKIYLTF